MERKIELLSKMVEELNGSDGSSYNDLMVSSISDLCERNFPEDPYEAARAVYFGKINNWSSHFMRIDGNGNVEEITEQKFNEEILGEQEEIMDDYLENFGEDKTYSELKEIIENEDSED